MNSAEKVEESASMKLRVVKEETAIATPLEYQLEIANLKLHVFKLQKEVTALNKACEKKNFYIQILRERLKKWTKRSKKA